MHVKKGDLVQVISGADRGKQGKVILIDRKHDRIKVQGVRIITKHVRPSNDKPGEIVKREGYLHVSKVMPVDPSTGKPTRIAHRVVDGKKVRVAAKTGTVLDTPWTRESRSSQS